MKWFFFNNKKIKTGWRSSLTLWESEINIYIYIYIRNQIIKIFRICNKRHHVLFFLRIINLYYSSSFKKKFVTDSRYNKFIVCIDTLILFFKKIKGLTFSYIIFYVILQREHKFKRSIIIDDDIGSPVIQKKYVWPVSELIFFY